MAAEARKVQDALTKLGDLSTSKQYRAWRQAIIANNQGAAAAKGFVGDMIHHVVGDMIHRRQLTTPHPPGPTVASRSLGAKLKE